MGGVGHKGGSVRECCFTLHFIISNDMSRLKFPQSLDTAKDLGRLLSKYKDTHYFTVLEGVAATYILYP